MMTWELYEIWLRDLLTQPLPSHRACPGPLQLCTDSRTLAPGDWFLPLAGPVFDGHAFFDQIFAAGAAGCFCARGQEHKIPPAHRTHVIYVEDTLHALWNLARGWRTSFPDVHVVALTGSAGKTTVKDLLALILSAAGPTLKTQGNFNNEIGVPKTLLQLTAEHRFCVVEAGARKPGDLKALMAIVQPDVTLCINVGNAHVGNFRDADELMTTKLEIIAHSPTHCKTIALFDDPKLRVRARELRSETLFFGTQAAADVTVRNVDWRPDGTMNVALALPHGQEILVSIPVAHEKYPVNLAAATAAAFALGIDCSLIPDALKKFEGVGGRYKAHRLANMTMIDDSYNANPESMAAGLATVCRSFPDREKVVILGDMVELGDRSILLHQELGRTCILPIKPKRLITVGSLGKVISDQAVAAGLSGDLVQNFSNVEDLIAANLDFKGTVVYVKASHSVGLFRYVNHVLSREVK